MSQEFNGYFSTCATNPLRHIPEPTTEFSFEAVDESTVLSELLRLKAKKATGLDKIPSKLLKDSAPVIVKPLTHIFNLSLATGEVPSDWKTAQITPIYKSGNRTNVANYRPVSVLSVTSKVMEKLVAKQVSCYMSKNNLLTVYQSGFRRHHSTATAVLKIVEDIRSASNSRQVTVALFLDLRKAFDTVNRAILLGKLQKLGFDGEVTKWFTSYLSGRLQCTNLQGQTSEKAEVTCGVPQGSVLGPLLFCLYVNDLPRVLEKCKIHMYADDTVLYYSAGTVKECEEAVSQDMKRVSEWLTDNRLSLHPDKTKYMLFGVPQKLRHVGRTVQITDVDKLLAEAGMVSLRHRTEKLSLVSVFNAVRGKVPLYISDMFRWTSPPIIRARTRTAVKLFADWDPYLLNCPVASLNGYKGSLRFYGPQLWNNLSLKQRQTVGLDSVRRRYSPRTDALRLSTFLLVDSTQEHQVMPSVKYYGTQHTKATVTTRRTCFCVLSTCKNVGNRTASVRAYERATYGLRESNFTILRCNCCTDSARSMCVPRTVLASSVLTPHFPVDLLNDHAEHTWTIPVYKDDLTGDCQLVSKMPRKAQKKTTRQDPKKRAAEDTRAASDDIGVSCTPRTYTLRNRASDVLPRPATLRLQKKRSRRSHDKNVRTKSTHGEL
ncbi:hypothetical protein Bbelb_270140 [Branchiostoma belcheri]|nr:hypothetical protein Bbelb_270140 [Branchiostoma belcheri]